MVFRRSRRLLPDGHAISWRQFVKMGGSVPGIPLTEEEKAVLKEPIDPRVERILVQIEMEKAAAERAKRALKKPSPDATHNECSDVLV
jgi:hypothetical protein